MIFVVLGMHKSGTTLLARTLHESGIVMGQDFPAGVDYLKAKYEARWVQEINDEILHADREELSLRVTSKLLPMQGISETIKEKMKRGIGEAQVHYAQWGFKDPRTALTYGYWKEHLPDHRLIIVYRNPVEVWKRYYPHLNKFSQLRLPFKVWYDYNKMILNYAKDSNNGQAIFLNFEQLLSSMAEWDRLREFVDVDLVNVCNPMQSTNRISEDDRDALSYKFLMSVVGRRAGKMFHEMEILRELDMTYSPYHNDSSIVI